MRKLWWDISDVCGPDVSGQDLAPFVYAVAFVSFYVMYHAIR